MCLPRNNVRVGRKDSQEQNLENTDIQEAVEGRGVSREDQEPEESDMLEVKERKHPSNRKWSVGRVHI